MALGFKWTICSYVGGDTAVHQAYKPYLVLRPGPEDYAIGEIQVQPRSGGSITVSGLGFRPSVIMLVSFRPRAANGTSDTAFGDRGGGMTYGAAGYESSVVTEWDSGTTYGIGDQVSHNGQWVATAVHSGSEPPSANWAQVGTVQFTGGAKHRHAFNTHHSTWREDSCLSVLFTSGVEVLRLELASLDADGFTLNQAINLYDQVDYVAWVALRGNYKTGIMEAGDTSIGSFSGTPTGAVFLSTKFLSGEVGTVKYSDWDYMQGLAGQNDQNVVWGGHVTSSWNYSTERWQDDAAILLCKAAIGSAFYGAEVEAKGVVSSWHPGGIDLQWPIFNNEAYRIGYVLTDDPAEAGYLETSWGTRPGGEFTEEDGYMFQPTTIRPEVILMTGTNYNFSYANTDPYDRPRSPDEFQPGAGAGLGWHAAPFLSSGADAYGVHTYQNAVAERGHYVNSGTIYARGCILAGQGANSNPPAQHQHGVNILDWPRIVGMNWRSADRRGANIRGLQNVSDVTP